MGTGPELQTAERRGWGRGAGLVRWPVQAGQGLEHSLRGVDAAIWVPRRVQDFRLTVRALLHHREHR
ncbi:unnamed protein product [Ectocarpus fasciculatus]